MDRKTLGILVVAFLFLGFYPTLLQKFYPEYGKKIRAEREAKSAAKAVSGSEQKASNASDKIESPVLRADEFLPEEDKAFSNDKLALIFNEKGGGIRQAGFLEYRDYEAKRPMQFFSLKDSKAAPASINFITPLSMPVESKYQIEQTAGGAVLKTSLLGGKLDVVKTYSLPRSSYAADLTISFKNRSTAPIELRYELFAGSRIPPRHSIDTQYIEANFFSLQNGKKELKHINESRLGKEVTSNGPLGWLAIKDRHFAVILKPKTETLFTGLVRGLGNHQFGASLVSPTFVVAPGSEVDHTFTLYIGPNDVKDLEATGLTDIVNFGKMDAIAKLMVGLLELINKLCHNYGISIIVLTFLINLLLFPLTRQSYMSLKRMQLIQPQINKLRELYKKNPERMNKEMMELYKKHKVNPFGGCLPMVLQMPVFIALYVALSKFTPLLTSGFLWMKDLSSPDRVGLPFSLPFLGNEIHVLPLLMCAAMFFQQKISQGSNQNQDPQMAQQQQMMTVMMPILFGFIFYSMPAGLVIYWLTNTVLMTLYQLHLKNITLE